MKKLIKLISLIFFGLLNVIILINAESVGFESIYDKGFPLGMNILLPPTFISVSEDICGNIDYDFCKLGFLKGNYSSFYNYYIEWVENNNINLPTLEGEDKKVILRNPKVITYWNPNRPTLYALEKIAKLVNETNAYVATNVFELEKLFLLYNQYTTRFEERPYFIFFEGIPYELIFNYAYLKNSGEVYDSSSYRWIYPFISPTLPLFYEPSQLEEDGSNFFWRFNLPHYLDFGTEWEKKVYSYFNSSFTFTGVGDSISSNISSFNFFKFAWDFDSSLNYGLTTVNVSWVNKTDKRSFTLEGFYVKFPHGFSIFYPSNIEGNEEISNIVPIGNILNKFKNFIYINNTNSVINLAKDRYSNNTACVYYYINNNSFNLGDDYIVMDGYLWPNGSFFIDNNAYYLNGSEVIKFNPNEVYYCKNGKWVDLDDDEEACKKFGKFYSSYKVVWDNNHKCLINSINEHPVWYRNSTGNQTIIDYTISSSSTNLKGFLDCVDKNGNIHKNGETVGDYLCSAGVWTPLFNDLNKFYIKEYPYTVKINLSLRNFASEPVILKDWKLKGLTKGWSVKLDTKDNKKIFNPNETIPIYLTITNEEGGENIDNYTLTLQFILNDNLCETPITIDIPFKTQYGMEYLSSYYFDKPIIYDATKGRTNTVNLYLVYDTFGALKKYRLCNSLSDNNCYFIITKVVEIPNGCNVEEDYKYFMNGSVPVYKVNCTKQPSKEDKIKICSAVILNESYLKNLCSGIINDKNSICDSHCNYISLITETYKKDFDFYLDYYSDNLYYKLKVTIKNTGTTNIKGINIDLQDLTGNCGIINGEYSDPNKLLVPGQVFEKVFMFNPTGLCKIKVNVTVDDPITKEKEIIINPFSENENKQVIKTDNPSLYPLYLILVGIISLIIGLYYIKKELE
jgi:hypothetical protein